MVLKLITKVIQAIFLCSFLSSCVNLQQIQAGMDEVDSYWGVINKKTLVNDGVREYEIKTTVANDVAIKSAKDLGFTIVESSQSFLSFKAKTPTPFTDAEYKKIKEIEEPMMQAAAATKVGTVTSKLFYLETGKNYVNAYVRFEALGDSKTKISVDFTLEPIGDTYGLVYGKNPPPEAVKKGLEKWWQAFEANLSGNK